MGKSTYAELLKDPRWQTTEESALGCYCGSEIVGPTKPRPKLARSQRRYQYFLQAQDIWPDLGFREFLVDPYFTRKEAR